MKINFCVETSAGFTEGSAELSYLDILTQLKRDLDSDDCMPTTDHEKAEKLIKELFDLLWKYSY
jgi:hypothetical protein